MVVATTKDRQSTATLGSKTSRELESACSQVLVRHDACTVLPDQAGREIGFHAPS